MGRTVWVVSWAIMFAVAAAVSMTLLLTRSPDESGRTVIRTAMCVRETGEDEDEARQRCNAAVADEVRSTCADDRVVAIEMVLQTTETEQTTTVLCDR